MQCMTGSDGKYRLMGSRFGFGRHPQASRLVDRVVFVVFSGRDEEVYRQPVPDSFPGPPTATATATAKTG